MSPELFIALVFVGPGVATFGLECLMFRLTRHRFWPLRLLPVALLAYPAARVWEAWRYGGPFSPLTLLSWEIVALSMVLGLVLGSLVGFLWAKRS